MTADDETKKIDPKKHKKYIQFLLYSYCHYILEIFNRLSDRTNINFQLLIELVNNYILNLFIIMLANQVNLDVAKGIIDDGVIIILDYISISHEEEFKTQNYNPKFNDAINFSYQKIHGRLLEVIPNKPVNNIINNLPVGLALSTSPKSLPNNLAYAIPNNVMLQSGFDNGYSTSPISKTQKKNRVTLNGIMNGGLGNYISIIGGVTNKTSRAIIFAAEIITRIFNLFSLYTIELPNRIQKPDAWLDIFEPVLIDILKDDIHEDDVQYSNSVFFTRLTYNLDIIECFINMILPQLLKISQLLSIQLDMVKGIQIANDITQIFQRLVNYKINDLHYVPSFIILTMIYNYLTSAEFDNNIVISLNNCCQTGIFIAHSYFNPFIPGDNNSIDTLGKYHYGIKQLRDVLGKSKKINNKNLITSIITLNSYLD